jgi:hypothetical protein
VVRRFIRNSCWYGAIVLTAAIAACSKPASSPDSAPTVEGENTAPASASNDGGTLVTGRAPATNTGTPAIVMLEPRHSAPLPEPTMMPYMDQVARNFIPSILFVRTGYPADFLNSDEELHNINVKDGGTREQIFNVALPPDVNYRHTFDRSGVYDVNCDIHGAMTAQIIAAASPYVTLADANGHFEISNVVPGAYLATVYAGAKPIEKMVEVTGSRIEVDLTQ